MFAPGRVLTPGLATAAMVAFNAKDRSLYGRREWHYGKADPVVAANYGWMCSEASRGRRFKLGRHDHGVVTRSRGAARAQTIRRFFDRSMGLRIVALTE